jgi:hypothetical protein
MGIVISTFVLENRFQERTFGCRYFFLTHKDGALKTLTASRESKFNDWEAAVSCHLERNGKLVTNWSKGWHPVVERLQYFQKITIPLFHLYISYRRDLHIDDAKVLVRVVTAADYLTFYDEENLGDARDFAEKLADAIFHSQVLVPLISKEVLDSMRERIDRGVVDWVLFEWILLVVCWEIKEYYNSSNYTTSPPAVFTPFQLLLPVDMGERNSSWNWTLSGEGVQATVSLALREYRRIKKMLYDNQYIHCEQIERLIPFPSVTDVMARIQGMRSERANGNFTRVVPVLNSLN